MRLHLRWPLRQCAALALPIGAWLLGAPLSPPAAAAAPSIYGWWSQTSVGGLGATPPDVPADGMFLENSPAGAVALAALKFTIPPGDVVDTLTLNVSGQAVITQPPIACPATSAFTAVEGGAWADRPTYDCAHPVTASVDSTNTKIAFSAKQLVKGVELAVVVLAAGAADRVAFTKPGADTLAVTNSAPTNTGVGSGDTAPSTLQALAPVVPPPALFVPAPAGPAAAPAVVAALPPPPRPQLIGGGSLAQPPLIRDVVTILLLPLVLLAILYWTDGFGAFALRRAVSRHRLVRLP